LLLGRPELAPFLGPGPFDEKSLTHAWTHPDPRMDTLYDSVASVAEEATRMDEDPATTFARIHELAAAADGRAVTVTEQAGAISPRQAGRVAPPRLSEPWFCCAQPTRVQLAASRAPAAGATAKCAEDGSQDGSQDGSGILKRPTAGE